ISRQHGRELSEAVTAAFSDPGIEIRGPMRVAMEEISLPLQPVTRETLERMLESEDRPQQVKARFLLESLERGEKLITRYSAPIQAVRFGDELLMIALSGEPVIDWAI